jgi:hypothetical protein
MNADCRQVLLLLLVAAAAAAAAIAAALHLQGGLSSSNEPGARALRCMRVLRRRVVRQLSRRKIEQGKGQTMGIMPMGQTSRPAAVPPTPVFNLFVSRMRR